MNEIWMLLATSLEQSQNGAFHRSAPAPALGRTFSCPVCCPCHAPHIEPAYATAGSYNERCGTRRCSRSSRWRHNWRRGKGCCRRCSDGRSGRWNAPARSEASTKSADNSLTKSLNLIVICLFVVVAGSASSEVTEQTPVLSQAIARGRR